MIDVSRQVPSTNYFSIMLQTLDINHLLCLALNITHSSPTLLVFDVIIISCNAELVISSETGMNKLSERLRSQIFLY